MSEQQDIMKLAMGKMMARAFIDNDYKQKLLANPRSVLSGIGLLPPPQVQIIVLENTRQKIYIPLPAPWANTKDPVFMEKLKNKPHQTLAEAGMNIAEDIEVSFVENTPQITHIVIPLPPGTEELSIEEI